MSWETSHYLLYTLAYKKNKIGVIFGWADFFLGGQYELGQYESGQYEKI